MRSPRAAAAAVAAVLALGACGYTAAGRYRAAGGAERIRVAAFENLSTDPALGAVMTSALREALARRGVDGGAGAPALIEGSVRALEGLPSSAGAATFRVALEARARLLVGGELRGERVVRREADHLGGADALETEGRRALALRRLADEAAEELLRGFGAEGGR